MLSIGILPKQFEGEFIEIQKNCINFSQKITPNIILMGKESKNFSEEHSIRHIDIEYEDNVPLINDIFKKLQENCKSNYYMYLNSDILLIEKQNLKNILKKITEKIGKNFMCIGERYEAQLNKLKDGVFVEGKLLEGRDLIERAITVGVNSGKFAVDYYLFPKNTSLNLEKMYAGCPGHDNVTIQYCKENNIPIVDISNVLFALHQDHTCRSKGGWLKSWYGEKSKINRSYIKGHIHSLDDADYIIDFEGNLIKGGKINRYTNVEMAISNRLEMFRNSIKEEKYMDAVDHWNLIQMRDPKKKYVSEKDQEIFGELLKELSILPIEFMIESNKDLEKQVDELKKLNILWRLHVIDKLDNKEVTEYLDNLKKELPKNLLIYRKINWKNKTEMYNKVIQNMPNKALLFNLYQYFLHTRIEGIRKSFLNNERNSDSNFDKFVYRYEPGYKWSDEEVPKLLDTEDNEI